MQDCCGLNAGVVTAQNYNLNLTMGRVQVVQKWRALQPNGRQSEPFDTKDECIDYIRTVLHSRATPLQTFEPVTETEPEAEEAVDTPVAATPTEEKETDTPE